MTKVSKHRQLLIAATVGSAYTVWGILIYLQPPFYPSEAESRGATPSQYGFVFGISNLTAFIFSVIFAQYGTKIGPKFLFNSGSFLQAIAGICFGLLALVKNLAPFLGLSYFLRILVGVGDAASWGSLLSLLMQLFPSRTAMVISLSEIATGFGFSIGPAVGSALYGVGGFMLPFIVVGSYGFLNSVALLFAIPKTSKSTEYANIDDIDNDDGSRSKARYPKARVQALLKYPRVVMPYIDNFICFTGNGFLESMLEPHLADYGINQAEVGLAFLILGVVYMTIQPCGGWVCDKLNTPAWMSVLGNVSLSIGFMFIGPIPILDIVTSPWLSKLSMAFVGFGNALVVTSTFLRAQRAAVYHGFKDDIDTYIIISGIWASTFFLGNFVGPTASGYLVESFGFRQTSVVFFVLILVVLISDLVEIAVKKKLERKNII